MSLGDFPILNGQPWHTAELGDVVRYQSQLMNQGDCSNLQVIGTDGRTKAFQMKAEVGERLRRVIAEWQAEVWPDKSVYLGAIGRRTAAAKGTAYQFGQYHRAEVQVGRWAARKR